MPYKKPEKRPREADIVRDIIRWLKQNNGDGYKVTGSVFQRVGEPDISGEVFFRGHLFHVKCEVKLPGETPTDIQRTRLDHYEKFGYLSIWCTSLQQFITLLELEAYRRRESNS